ncbi:TetR/AcrR family transcriptional regulator [Roseibium sp. CAU 1637]|uniref:TetR/AcrR family transcriptional regulator n=1 Tax=Roseibium limicola TaxID=2816037 RepID=A0A939J978_9HYPH|nr:TetR/AcrR family transcriptional regulator [Roseibium limicola]MBO0345609.1 TetR/AcrR family transcriptional regulator [Roseibium limicola]
MKPSSHALEKGSKPGTLKLERTSLCRPRGRQKVHETETLKSQVIEIAFQTFQKHSYKGTTMSLIATNCGISKRTLYELFPSKTDLFAELAMLHRSNIVQLSGDYDNLPLEQALLEIFRVERCDEEHRQQSAEMRLFYVEAVANPELGEILKKFCGADLHNLLTGWVIGQVERGRISSPSPPDTAKYLMDVLIGAQIFRAKDPASIPGVSDLRTYMRNAVAMLVHGLAPREDP